MSYYGHPYFNSFYNDDDDEVHAYMSSLQRRRQAAEYAAQVEAQNRARIQAEREAALRAAQERHAQQIAAARRERAMREAMERERKREQALNAAVEQHRREEISAAIAAERRRQMQAAEAYARSIKEAEDRARAQQAQKQVQQAQKQLQQQQLQQQQQQQAKRQGADTDEEDTGLENINSLFGSMFGFNVAPGSPETTTKPVPKPPKKKARSPPPKPQQPPAATPQASAPSFSDVPDVLNDFFGLGFNQGQAGNKASGASDVCNNATQGLNDALKRKGCDYVPKPKSDSEDEDAASTAPKAKEPSPAPAQTKEQPKTAEKTLDPHAKAFQPSDHTKQRCPKPNPDAPFTSFLDSQNELHPFLHDVLTNVETAMGEDGSDGDAEGEGPTAKRRAKRKSKKARKAARAAAAAAADKEASQAPSGGAKAPAPTPAKKPSFGSVSTDTDAPMHAIPTPEQVAHPAHVAPSAMAGSGKDKPKPPAQAPRFETPAADDEPEPSISVEQRTAALDQVMKLGEQLTLLKANFKFPNKLAFGPSTPDASQPPLLFNRTNQPYHQQAHELLQLILATDNIESHGDMTIRKERKALVRNIEAAIDDLECKRNAQWQKVREARDRGESSSEYEDDTTDASDWEGPKKR